MNYLTRAVAAAVKRSRFSHQAPHKRLLVLHPITVIQHSSSSSLFYSTSCTTTKTPTPRKPYNKTENPQQSLSRPSLVDWPRPSEIPWQAKVANSVNLIGHVQIPVQSQASPDGKFWAGTVITQHDANIPNSPYFWIPIIFEGDLAHIAACHLKEKDCVYIAGQLSADPPPFILSQGQANVQVMVHSINFVQVSSQLKKSFVSGKQEESVISHSASVTKDGDPTLSSWRDLIKNPKQWWDHRENKRNGLVKEKHPDFKHKDSGLALWLNSAPIWVFPGLEGLEFAVPLRKLKQVKDFGKDDLWKNLVENPKKWWDNRSDKVNKKSPDFKHKDTGEGLWLSDSPAWVVSRLPTLKANQNISTGKSRKTSLPGAI